MIVMGFDPGWANLGISVFDTDAKEVLEGVCLRAGVKTAPLKFSNEVWPELERLHMLHGVQAVAMEHPPLFPTAVSNTALIWFTMGIVAAWAKRYDLDVKSVTPKAIKAGTARILGQPLNRRKMPSKGEVKQAVEIYTGQDGAAADHTNDATMAAILCYPPR